MRKQEIPINVKMPIRASNQKIAVLVEKGLLQQCIAKGTCELLKSGSIIAASDISTSLDLIKSIGIEMWRLEKRLVNAKMAIMEKPEINGEQVFDQLQRIRDVLLKHEIAIEDHVGESYNDGMLALRPLHFEEDASLPKGVMKIVETVKPAVYYKNQLISNGEVIVAKSKEN